MVLSKFGTEKVKKALKKWSEKEVAKFFLAAET